MEHSALLKAGKKTKVLCISTYIKSLGVKLGNASRAQLLLEQWEALVTLYIYWSSAGCVFQLNKYKRKKILGIFIEIYFLIFKRRL